MPESLRLIKKYPNRRLYDTRISAYITLCDVKGLVLSLENFRVEDARTGTDLTRNILLQIILDEEAVGVPLFTTEVLEQMIRFHGHSMQGMLAQYLEANIKSFSDPQKKLQEQSLPGECISQAQNMFYGIQNPGIAAEKTNKPNNSDK